MKYKCINAFHIKLIAIITMVIDHIAVRTDLLMRLVPAESVDSLYRVFRDVGRIAFPLFAFLIIEGALHTKNWVKYCIRLLVFAILTEVPFDLYSSKDAWYFGYQNVLFTLLLGLIAVQVLKRYEGDMKLTLYIVSVICCAVIAEFIKSDYGSAGVVMMGVMGLAAEKERITRFIGSAIGKYLNVILFAVGVCVLALMTNYPREYFALIGLIPIFLYNGKRGPSGQIIKYLMYCVYPLQFIILLII